MQWSPCGTYLATLHRQGVAVWGGPNFNRITRYAHANSRLLQFSPCERYLISFSSQEPTNPCDPATVQFCIFDVRTSKKLRVFEGPQDEFSKYLGGANTVRAVAPDIVAWFHMAILVCIISIYDDDVYNI